MCDWLDGTRLALRRDVGACIMRYTADARHRSRVGEIYEDCTYHPCLCAVVDFDKRDIQGISLIDWSAPSSCRLDHCGARAPDDGAQRRQ
jgi:hypothetical protein